MAKVYPIWVHGPLGEPPRMLMCDGYPLQQHNPGTDSGERTAGWVLRVPLEDSIGF